MGEASAGRGRPVLARLRFPCSEVAWCELSSIGGRAFAEVLNDDAYAGLKAMVTRAEEVLRARVVWNVNSTARGGGARPFLCQTSTPMRDSTKAP